MSYTQARADHEYLWTTYGAPDDMTGGYGRESEDLLDLLKKPCKSVAEDIYSDQIQYWFQVGPDRHQNQNLHGDEWRTDPRVEAIACRYDAAVSR